MEGMEFKLHTSFPDDLENDWNALLDVSITHVPFLRFEYLHIWWQSRCGAEWPQKAQLCLISAHRAGQLLPCVMPSAEVARRAHVPLGNLAAQDGLVERLCLNDVATEEVMGPARNNFIDTAGAT